VDQHEGKQLVLASSDASYSLKLVECTYMLRAQSCQAEQITRDSIVALDSVFEIDLLVVVCHAGAMDDALGDREAIAPAIQMHPYSIPKQTNNNNTFCHLPSFYARKEGKDRVVLCKTWNE
jgi:hypothetical protein